MGLYLRYWRPGKVLECSAIGFVLVHRGIFGGQWVAGSPSLAPMFTLSAMALAIAIIVYGFLASALPVWLLLAPRDYLSTFVKLGVGRCCWPSAFSLCARSCRCPPFTRFIDGTGPIFAGKIFPVLLHHHRLRRHLRLPLADLLRHHAEDDRPGDARLAGRLRLDAARKLRRHHGHDRRLRRCSPGVYFAVNSPAGIVGATAAAAVDDHLQLGLSGHRRRDGGSGAAASAKQTLFYRTGGAPSLALGMAHIFARGRRRRCGPRLLVSLRHHVRGAVHPDDHRRRHARGPLHAAGSAGPRLEAARPHAAGCRA